MSIEQEAKANVTSAYVGLLIIDLSPIGDQAYYLCNDADVTFDSQNYVKWPFKIENIKQTSAGAPPRALLTIGNVGSVLGASIFAVDDAVGGRVTYIETFADFLDVPGAISMPPKKFLIRQKVQHDRNVLAFQLGSLLDTQQYLPKHQMLRSKYPGLGVNKHVQ